MKINDPKKKNAHTQSGHVTREKEYRADGLPKTGGYSVDKKPKIDPRISSPAQTKHEREPGHPAKL